MSTSDTKRKSGLAYAKDRLAVIRKCESEALDLAIAYEEAGGNENAPKVLLHKARLARALQERDSDSASAIEKQLNALGIRRNTGNWIFADGVVKP